MVGLECLARTGKQVGKLIQGHLVRKELQKRKKAKGFGREKMKFGVGVVSMRPWMRLGKTLRGE